MLQPLLVRVFRVADLIHDADALAVVGVDRLVERDGVTDRVEREHDVPPRDVQFLCDLVKRRFAAGGGSQALFCLQDLIGGVARGAADADGAVVAQVAPDLPGNHGYAVGGKAHVVVFGVKIVDGLDQTDAADLKQIVHVLAAADEFLDYGQHQPEVAGNELLARVSVAVLCADEQCPAGVAAQDFQVGRVDTADLDFSKHKKFLPSGTP